MDVQVGIPAKSGVGGGIIAVSPGKFGIAVISPPLDAAGNSVNAKSYRGYLECTGRQSLRGETEIKRSAGVLE